ncbi:alpha-L-fucosidase [Flavitalea sp.]|nr:alpha-L-fucosidase [Flavitalea sp.]
MKKYLLSFLVYCYVGSSVAQTQPGYLSGYTPSQENLAQRETFQDNKFGLFIHWGIYSIMGNGEWVMHQQKIPYKNYKKLADFFKPEQFKAKDWVKMAKAAGMKYITITSRHHDGFSMFRTKASPYNIIDATPYKNDPIKELARECLKEGIELNLYYSLLDWGREDYGFGKSIVNGAPQNTDWNSYINFMKTQLTELITNYPNIRGIWFDGHWERKTANWHYDEIYTLIHKLNPKILVGNNHHLTPFAGEDFQMYEKDLPGENKGGFSATSKVGNLPLETCETINGSWGFNIKDTSYKSVKTIIHYIVNAAGRNSNFLLNVGPMPNGKIQTEFTDTLAAVGRWMASNGVSIYGTRGNLIAPQPWGVITKKDKTLFIHILKQPESAEILIPGLNEKVGGVQLLKGGSRLEYNQNAEGLSIKTVNLKLDLYDTVIQVNLQ